MEVVVILIFQLRKCVRKMVIKKLRRLSVGLSLCMISLYKFMEITTRCDLVELMKPQVLQNSAVELDIEDRVFEFRRHACMINVGILKIEDLLRTSTLTLLQLC